ncbi:MAG TPA: NAD(+)/NADH kinase [Candidatus Paceibacterota bacterium]|nr:NAD(+)/NADH kinase [Verrucomicrobiota bacterium]HRY50228.1 NAD(+)/NADH kinase [Candidatus Paceibacterota bacterium]HRZ99363.1 NAD(+)/NADH kinase [Candidatus Paceibacterota bacterium]
MKKNRSKIRRIGLVANPEKSDAAAVVARAAARIQAAGCQPIADEATARLVRMKITQLPQPASLARAVDLLLVFGGDGTMLRIGREVAGLRTPILGINLGGLGFLTAVSSSKLNEALEKVWAGEFQLEPRPLIQATGLAQGQPLNHLALNDFVISRGATSRMIELQVSVDQQVLTQYRCDGLIVSSPTGSTAYGLAAGGAVVCPTAEVLTLTPICPHTLSNRSVVVSLRSQIQVTVISRKLDTIFTADGQSQSILGAGDSVIIKRSPRSVQLLHLNGTSFFETLRQKLNWSGSHVLPIQP